MLRAFILGSSQPQKKALIILQACLELPHKNKPMTPLHMGPVRLKQYTMVYINTYMYSIHWIISRLYITTLFEFIDLYLIIFINLASVIDGAGVVFNGSVNHRHIFICM